MLFFSIVSREKKQVGINTKIRLNKSYNQNLIKKEKIKMTNKRITHEKMIDFLYSKYLNTYNFCRLSKEAKILDEKIEAMDSQLRMLLPDEHVKMVTAYSDLCAEENEVSCRQFFKDGIKMVLALLNIQLPKDMPTIHSKPTSERSGTLEAKNKPRR